MNARSKWSVRSCRFIFRMNGYRPPGTKSIFHNFSLLIVHQRVVFLFKLLNQCFWQEWSSDKPNLFEFNPFQFTEPRPLCYFRMNPVIRIDSSSRLLIQPAIGDNLRMKEFIWRFLKSCRVRGVSRWKSAAHQPDILGFWKIFGDIGERSLNEFRFCLATFCSNTVFFGYLYYRKVEC